MKRCMMMGLIAMCATAFGAMKIGTVDMMLLVQNHPSSDSNKKLLLGTEKGYQDELDAMKADLDAIQDEGRKIAEGLKSPMLTEAAKQATEEKLMDIQKRYVQKQQELRAAAMKNQQHLGELETRLLKSLADDLKARIKKFADKAGYDLIVDSAAAIYAGQDLDVTDEILKSMDVDPKKARGKERDEGK